MTSRQGKTKNQKLAMQCAWQGKPQSYSKQM